jgi:predicted MPP superfamily phosphohydrolase
MLTGDFVSYTRHLPLLREALRPLRAPYGVYASLGNHDHWSDPVALGRLLEELGITLLLNQHRIVNIGAATLAVAGVAGPTSRQRWQIFRQRRQSSCWRTRRITLTSPLALR